MRDNEEAAKVVSELKAVCVLCSSQEEARTRIAAELEPRYPGVVALIDDFLPFLQLKAR